MMNKSTPIREPSKLGIYIKKFRKEEHFTQKELSDLSKKIAKPGFSKQFISCIESGSRTCVYNFGILKSLSKILKLPLSTVYKLNGYPRRHLTQCREYGLNLRKSLIKRNLSATSTAKALGASISTIRKWMYGISSPAFQNELMLITRFHINPKCFGPKDSYKLHKFFHSPGCQKFKLLRINNNWNLNDIYKITGISNMMLLRVENGKSFNFNIIYKLSHLYHVKIRQITNHKFSFYQIHKYINDNSSRLKIVRELMNKSLNEIQNKLPNDVSLMTVEDNKQPVSIRLISLLAIVYRIHFKALLYLVDYSISNKYQQEETGNKLRSIRKNHHLSQLSIEKLTHGIISKAVLSRWETGTTKISFSKIPYLAKVMDIPTQKLLNLLGFKINYSKSNSIPKSLEYYKV